MNGLTTVLVVAQLLSPSPQLLQTHIGLELRIDYDARSLEGSATISVRNTGSDPTSTIPLQIGRLMTATEIRGPRGESLRFTQDVIRMQGWEEYQVNQIEVALARPILPGDSATVTAHYGGVLVPYTETGMLYVRDHIAPEFTILRSEALAFPQLGVPSFTDTRSMPRADFTATASITVPPDQVVATGFEPFEVRNLGDARTWRFSSPEPIPFLNITIAPYEEIDGAVARFLHFPEDLEGATRLEEAASSAAELYREWFGADFGDRRLTIMEIPEGYGSQAHRVAGIIQTADAFRSADQATQLYHELAHLVHPPDAEHPAPRWNEGLATFLQYRVASVRDGRSLDQAMQTVFDRALRVSADEPAALAELGRLDLTDRAYSVGAVFFYLLYRQMGSEQFDAALSEWIATYSTGTTSDDLVEVLRTHDETVGPIIDEWMYSAGWTDRVGTGTSLRDLVGIYRNLLAPAGARGGT